MKQKRILLVEDEAITAMRIKSSLENMGYAVTSTVFSGEEALAHIEEDRPDLVLMDIVLDGQMDGIETAMEIRSRFKIPVVYLTAHSKESMLKRIKTTEPFGYIIKPFDEGELRAVVEIAFYKHETEQSLKKHKEQLEAAVKSRTAELESAVKRLQTAEKDLRSYARELEESNTTLKVLLKQRESDERQFQDNMLANIKHLIMPYIEKLRSGSTSTEERSWLDIIESNLNEIVSPFSARLSVLYLDLTPREIMIADLIKDGKQDKEIGTLLNISLDTVKAHRKNIRRKLGIYNTRMNLRTKLLSLAE